MYNTGELSRSERFLLNRRRLGFTNKQYTEKYKVTKNQLTSWENGRNTDTIPDVILHPKMTMGEALFIARRRRSWGIREAAKIIGVSHVTYLEYEKDRASENVIRLPIKFWNKRGWPKLKTKITKPQAIVE